MIARFSNDGVQIDLGTLEYGFLYLTLSYVLDGVALTDNEFRNILGMSRENAEELMRHLEITEAEARSRGSHWDHGPRSDD
ncbi:hypothetical protein AB0L40_26795 [Patulibacter sp. NPDC049589]|uniref:hypothetical protein n=1 Tax=Patulibacter sp. NPDC049589 TaxID=3154731 RepID=UPI003435EB5C